MREDDTFSTNEVAVFTGATYRQLDYWCRVGLIPGQTYSIGSGSRRRWSVEAVERARTLVAVSRIRTRPFVEIVDLLERIGVLDVVEAHLGIAALPPPRSSTRAALPPPRLAS